MNKKQIRKRYDGKCFFCNEQEYALLDAHRIKEGKDGGTYHWINMLTICSNCHRKIHAGLIKVLGRHFCTKGTYVVNFIDEDGVEKWKE